MEVKDYTCIVCPLSCHITLKAEEKEILEVMGFGCKRGEKFAISEYTNPVRTLTTIVKLENANYNCLPVISDGSIPKDKIDQCLKKLKTIKVKAPITKGDIIIKDLLSTGVNIISAKSVKERG